MGYSNDPAQTAYQTAELSADRHGNAARTGESIQQCNIPLSAEIYLTVLTIKVALGRKSVLDSSPRYDLQAKSNEESMGA